MTTPDQPPPVHAPISLPHGPAICYSGYRRGQSPDSRIYPSVDEIREDLHLLARHWRLLRLYDCSAHAQRVLQVIEEDQLPFQVMLGAYLAAEVSNPGCPWGGLHSDDQLAANRLENQAELERLVQLATQHSGVVFSVAVGNEATVDWTDHLVPVERMIEHVRWVKARLTQPVTFCENYVPWQTKLQDLVAELDFISVHTYPLWEYKPIHEALAYTQDNVVSVARLYPDKPVVITEAGWCTHSNGRGMHAGDAVPELQALYYQDLMNWTNADGVLCFVFEAFDEPWKGSPDPLEPEKHWGLFNVDRQPKPVIRSLYPELPVAHAGHVANHPA
ncbi:MAG: glycosyl hydrolase family 17 protein [Rubrivivax sp.]|jgi:exo-beta-1,3-glucanase (GH17 family)|nr:glycosyl hydrolase family 17 protein [Rubrivivax sp.]